MRVLARRIEKLEARQQYLMAGGVLHWGAQNSRCRGGFAPQPPIRLRFGHVRQLLGNYTGERHVVIAKHLPERNGQEWVEFEELPGPAPAEPPPDPRLSQYLDIVFVAPRGASGREAE